MSAFIVEDSLIDAMVTFVFNKAKHIQYIAEIHDQQKLGEMLVAENYRSVNARYRGETGEPHPYKFREYSGDMEPMQIISAAQCLCYQSCECDDWRSTMSFKVLMEIISSAANDLPGHSKAQWGMPANPARTVGRSPAVIHLSQSRRV